MIESDLFHIKRKRWNLINGLKRFTQWAFSLEKTEKSRKIKRNKNREEFYKMPPVSARQWSSIIFACKASFCKCSLISGRSSYNLSGQFCMIYYWKGMICQPSTFKFSRPYCRTKAWTRQSHYRSDCQNPAMQWRCGRHHYSGRQEGKLGHRRQALEWLIMSYAGFMAVRPWNLLQVYFQKRCSKGLTVTPWNRMDSVMTISVKWISSRASDSDNPLSIAYIR